MKGQVLKVFLPASLRDISLKASREAPGLLTSDNVDDRAVEHYYFKESQVDIRSLKSGFLRVVEFGSGGTGVLVSRSGHILTARHVLEQPIQQYEDSKFYASQIGKDMESIYYQGRQISKPGWYKQDLLDASTTEDLAIIQILDLADKDPIVLSKRPASSGDSVFNLGYPDYSQRALVLSVGRVLNKTIMTRSEDSRHLFVSNAEATNGNSGGPVLNSDGELVGIVTSGGNGFFTTNASSEDLAAIQKALAKLRLK